MRSPRLPGDATSRILGLDVARALAVVGMVVVNFRLMLTEGGSEGGPFMVFSHLDGRAAAVFVMLAGMGAAILTRDARVDATHAAAARKRLLLRGLVLLCIGIPLVYVWEAEILHVYAVLMASAALLVTARTRTILLAAAGAALAWSALNLFLDYRVPGDFETFTTRNIDAVYVDNTVRDLLFEGHYPVAPWAALFLLGMALGRGRLDRARARVMVVVGVAMIVAGEAVAAGVAHVANGESLLRATNRGPVPPSVVFVVAGVGAALAVIGACILWTDSGRGAPLVGVLAPAGQCALTLYVAHLVIGIGIPALFSAHTGWGTTPAFLYAVAFSAAGIAFCVLWRRHFPRGPLEAVVRRVAGENRRRY